MKIKSLAFFAALVALTALKPIENEQNSFAVVELFTSEGCSSCPVADDLLKEMTGILRKENKNVIALSFHVTYWDKQGWVDPYSNELFTERQRKYASALKLTQLYTPQAIVNGSIEFTGSNPFGFRGAVETCVANSSPYILNGEAVIKDSTLSLSYDLNKIPKNSVLHVAVVEKNITHKILRGENKNRTLNHFNVVRNFETMELKSKDSVILKLKDTFKPEQIELILLVQNVKSLKIIHATKLSVTSSI